MPFGDLAIKQCAGNLIPRLFVSNSSTAIQTNIDLLIENYKMSLFDVLKIGEFGSAIKIETIRDLKKTLFLKPAQGKYRGIVIYNSQNLTTEAQNSLLKILEEPPESTLIILAAPNENLLLPTIISRCEIVRIQSSKLKVQSSKQNIRGNPLEIRVNQLDIGERFKLAEELTKKQDKEEALEEVRKRVEKWLENQAFELKKMITENNLDNSLISNLKIIVHTQKHIKQNLNLRLVLENCFLNLC